MLQKNKYQVSGVVKKIILLFLIILTGCFDFDSHHIISKYYLTAVDVQDNMCLSYPVDENHTLYSTVISSTVFEVQWNDNFIVVKQHPSYYKVDIINIFRRHIVDSIKLDSNTDKLKIGWKADSLSKKKYELEKGKFAFLLGKAKKDITFYYLIDVEKNGNPELFFTAKQLDSALKKRNVGQLNNIKRFDYLD